LSPLPTNPNLEWWVLASNEPLFDYEYLGKYLRTNVNTERMKFKNIEGFEIWGEEEGKSFTSPRSICQNFSLVLNAERKRLGLKFFGMKVELL